MKLLILQLSDVHCTDENIEHNVRIDKIGSALRSIGNVDKVILCFSGDLSASGSTTEINSGRAFINKVIIAMSKSLKCGHIETYIVPGNHDISIPESGHSSADILSWNRNEKIESELREMKPFFEYAHSIGCFVNNELIDDITIDLDGKTLQLTLLNSAPFSTRQNDNKELHFFPSSICDKLVRKKDTDYKITMVHHSYEWFEWDTKETLKKFMFFDDIVLFGHDHQSEQVSIQDGEGKKLNYIVGGEFSLHNDNCAFNAIVLDTMTDTFNCHRFTWDSNENIFTRKENKTIYKNNVTLSPLSTFLRKLLLGNKQISPLITDYYVFPDLKVKGEWFTDSDDVDTIDESVIFSKLKKEKVIRITGDNNSGKTMLLKYLYSISVDNGFIPLFIESSSRTESNFEKMLKHLFEVQYGDNICFDLYLQEDPSREIIFIDDMDRITNTKAQLQLIDNIKKSGRLLIYVDSENDNELQEMVKEHLDGKTIGTLSIKPFFKESRDKLIERICSIKCATEEETEAIIVALDYMVQCQPYLFTLSPANLIPYILFLLNEKTEKHAQNTISMVFETNTRTQLLDVIRESELVPYMSLLSYISSDMYFDKRVDTISLLSFSELVNTFNSKRRANIKAKLFLENCKKANILIEDSDDFAFKFSNNNVMAYFVACSIARDLEKDFTNTQNLEKIISQICFGINDLIIVFLSYLMRNNSVIMRLAAQTFKHIEDSPSWNIESQNLPFLNDIEDTTKGIPTSQEKNEVKRQTEIVEQERHEVIKFRNAFDYSEQDIEKFKTIRALKCCQIISRVLVDQYGALEADEVDGIIETIYTIPPQIVYAHLKPVQDNIEGMCDYLYNYSLENSEQSYTKDDIRRMLGTAGTAMALDILNNVAFNASSDSTIEELQHYNTTSMVQDVMQLMLIENTRHTKCFVDSAIQLQRKYDGNAFIRKVIALIARKHILYSHKKIDHTQISRLVSANIFTEKHKKSLLIAQAKNDN